MAAGKDYLVQAMQEHSLFEGCGRPFCKRLSSVASRCTVEAGEELDLSECGVLLFVEKGTLRVRVDDGPAVVFGPGSSLNALGMLGLEARDEMQSQRQGFAGGSIPAGYEMDNFTGKVPNIYASPESRAADLTEDELCFFSLCPHAAMPFPPKSKRFSDEDLPTSFLHVEGGLPEDVPVEKCDKDALLPEGGAILVEVRTSDVEEIHKKTKGENYDREAAIRFEQNCTNQVRNWKLVERLCRRKFFPDTPSEVSWALSQIAVPFVVEQGKDIVTEDTTGEVADTLIILDSGAATAERRVNGEDGEDRVIGRLRQGAIIGDFCLIGAEIPRPASVRSRTRVEAIKIPPKKLLRMLGRFPGIMRCMAKRIEVIAEMMKACQPTKAEVTASLHLFRTFDMITLNDIAAAGELRAMPCGTAVVEQGSEEGKLCVLQYGYCAVEIKEMGQVAEVPTGNCFGERTMLGISKQANATVRVMTPFALVLQIPKASLELVIERHPGAVEKFEEMKRTPMEGRVKGMGVGLVGLFRRCNADFLDVLTSGMQTRGYLPGQALVVEEVEEKDPAMFVLTGGSVVSLRKGKTIGMLASGSTFGELAMLGQSKVRKVTIHAKSYSVVRVIPQSVFKSALEKYPAMEDHFKKSIRGPESGKPEVQWPVLKQAPQRFQYLVDLYQERKSLPVGVEIKELETAAFLVVSGRIEVHNDESKCIDVVESGHCYKEDILLGIDASARPAHFVPTVPTEVCILTPATWDKVMAEFPEKQEEVIRAILGFTASRSKAKLGYQTGPAGKIQVLENSSLFRFVSTEFKEFVAERLEARVFRPGFEVVGPGLAGDNMFFWLEGEGEERMTDAKVATKVRSGQVFGESSLLHMTATYPVSLYSVGVSVAEVLSRRDFQEALDNFPVENDMHLRLREQCFGQVSSADMAALLQDSVSFSEISGKLISYLCKTVRMCFFGPGEVLYQRGDPCVMGSTDFYLVFGGKAQAEGRGGVLFSHFKRGEVIGEAEAFGVTNERTATVRACLDQGLLCCARIRGKDVEAGLIARPTKVDSIVKVCSKREALHREIEDQRAAWLEHTAVPALGRSPLLAGCPEEFLKQVAVPLYESLYASDMVISEVGESASSMLIILRGEADLEARDGAVVGKLTEGATFGEVALLGLFSSRMATVRARTSCRILSVTAEALQQALAGPHGKALVEGFERLIYSRRKQVATGAPITCLPVDAKPDCVSVRGVSLLSEQILLAPNEVWLPLPDSDPCGPYIGVLAVGRAKLEMVHDGQVVMQLIPGNLMMEGMAAEYGAHLRALDGQHCEGYRIRQTDFMMAVTSSPASQDWFWRFKLLVKEARSNMQRRLGGARGLMDCVMPQSKDKEILDYQAQRLKSISRAKSLREERGRSLGKLPPLACDGDSRRSSKRGPSPIVFNKGINAYPAMQLPSLASKGSSSHNSSRMSRASSEPQLRNLIRRSATGAMCRDIGMSRQQLPLPTSTA
eukprot:TRINITY_DN38136_c0_g1_i2.p1 TRINITY_DN38136_c0_g1~~TRINITY_DN38136_c0_g1_i2.p1  ORF type:complete len:1517 (-),score=269.81 TRINITY_DN38136_c0_g1_i2:238-4683(-)